MSALPLAANFPPATEAEWRARVEEALRGRPFSSIVGKAAGGLAIPPLSPRAKDAEAIAGRAPGIGWEVLQRVDHPDPAAANAQALDDLEGGANGLSLVFAGSVGDHGYGIGASADQIARVLAGVEPDADISIDCDLSRETKNAGAEIAKLLVRRGIAPERTRIRFGFDPLGAIARSGSAPLAWNALEPIFIRTVVEVADQGFAGPFSVADGRIVHAAGGSEAQELAFAISVALAYLRALEGAGHPLERARSMIYFRLAADAEQFLTIAKFRALRLLWAKVESECGLVPRPALVAGETAWRMMSRQDPHVNLLRTAIATFAAGIGGADAVTVLPFTLPHGLPDAFARRMARNTQIVLLEESRLGGVADPTAGSDAIEHLTGALCRQAWALFQEIEAGGGAHAAIEQGQIQKQVAAVRTERQTAAVRRTDAMIGTSDFPDLAEALVRVLDVPRRATTPVARTFEALAPIRLSEPFEALRDRSEALRARTGKRPAVFLATLGRPADFTPRAIWTRNLLAAGGIDCVASGDGPLPDQFRAYGSPVACLCSSDAVYADQGTAAARALKDAGAGPLLLAGRPKTIEADLTAAGVTEVVQAGQDAVALLGRLLDALEGERP